MLKQVSKHYLIWSCSLSRDHIWSGGVMRYVFASFCSIPRIG